MNIFSILSDEPEAIEDEQHKEFALILIKKQRQKRLRAENLAQTSVIKDLEEQAKTEKAKLIEQERTLNDLQAEIDAKESTFRLKWADQSRIQDLERQLQNEIEYRQTLEEELVRLQHLARIGGAVRKRTIDSLLKVSEGPRDILVTDMFCFSGRAVAHAQDNRINRTEYEDFYGLPPDRVCELVEYGGCNDLFYALNIRANVQLLTDRVIITDCPPYSRSQFDQCWEQIQAVLDGFSTPEEYRVAFSADPAFRKLLERLEEEYHDFCRHLSGKVDSLGNSISFP